MGRLAEASGARLGRDGCATGVVGMIVPGMTGGVISGRGVADVVAKSVGTTGGVSGRGVVVCMYCPVAAARKNVAATIAICRFRFMAFETHFSVSRNVTIE
ncbi:MAG: hypothetical protein KGK00_06165 [Paracoccaceae bacterium]|nr:hypothetical protein [Paracoccaceae bacterium]